MTSEPLGKNLCIIGAGALGLVTTKNFIEQGFHVTTYERNDYVGGLWHVTNDPSQTSVLEGTRANISKHGACFSDFPYPETTSLHPKSKETINYLDSFADHFELRKYIKLSTTVTEISRSEAKDKWVVKTRPTNEKNGTLEAKEFDRLILCNSPHRKVTTPAKLKDPGPFEGEVIHSREFKDPSKYNGKNVVVVGTSATAVDTIEFCRAAGAKKLYMSHRRAIRLLPRVKEGRAIDVDLTRRFALVGSYMRSISPAFSEFMMNKFMQKLRVETWPELATHPAFTESENRKLPSVSSNNPTVSEELPINLLNGSVESVHAIDRFTGPSSLLLTDGTELHNIDAIICCTGYTFDFSLLPASVNPTNAALIPSHLLSALKASEHYRPDLTIPWAYRGLLSIAHPHSLAFFGNTIYRRGGLPLYDLVSMAVAQLWTDNYPMPSKSEMEAEREAHFTFFLSELDKGDVRHTGLMRGVEFDIWLNRVAGTGVWERLGWGWEGWKFWWRERELWGLLMDGIDSPHALRLFESGREGGRKVWPGALEAVRKANREVQEGADRWKREHEEELGKVKKG